MSNENAPKPSSAKRDGVTTDPQSGSSTTNLPAPSPSGQGSGGITPTKITSPSQPAGSPPGTGDAGSEKNLRKTEDAASDKETDEQKMNREAKENETVDKETGVVSRTVENKEGEKTFVSAVDSEAADKHMERIKGAPTFENQTQSLLGTPGNVNLTQDGTLAGDKSLRDDRELDEVYQEMEDKAGPNPLPNREGNEMLKATNFITTATGVGAMGGIDRRTNNMARELESLSKKDSLSQEDKDRLEQMSKQLKDMGKVPA